MTAPHDADRRIRTFLADGPELLPDRSFDAVRASIERTHQRGWFAPRRIAAMNTFAKLAMGAAALVLVAVALLPTFGGLGGGADPSPSPSPSRSLRPEPTPIEGAAPPAGDLSIGRHHWTQNGIGYSLGFTTEGWQSGGVTVPPDGSLLRNGVASIWMPMWSIDGVFSDPCAHVPGPVLSPSAADLAAAVAALPGFDVLAKPEEITVGGRTATHVVIKATADIGCEPTDYFMWYDDVRCEDADPCARYAATVTQVNRVWIWEIDGRHIWIEVETKWDANAALEAEIADLIASIEFD